MEEKTCSKQARELIQTPGDVQGLDMHRRFWKVSFGMCGLWKDSSLALHRPRARAYAACLDLQHLALGR